MENKIESLLALRAEEQKAVSACLQLQATVERLRDRAKAIVEDLKRQAKLAGHPIAYAIPSQPGNVCVISTDMFAEVVLHVVQS